jgi:hypothetical protein
MQQLELEIICKRYPNCHRVWSKQTSCIIDVRVYDSNINSYLSSTPADILRKQEPEKKKKCPQPCLDSRKDFTPYVLSVDGMLASEAKKLNTVGR